jgi:hypothetical protein
MKKELGVIRIKKLLPIILVIAVVGIGAYLYLNKGGQTGGLPSSGEIFQGTLKTAVSKGIPFKCEMEGEDGEVVTTWVKGEKMYAESKVEGKMQYTILKDNCTWSWDETGQQAVKYCFEQVDYEDFNPTSTETTTQETETTEAQTPEYNCVPTTISDSKFDPPSDINFMSF